VVQVAPWMTSRTRDIKDSLLRFHNEVIEFCEYVSPTKEEHAFREKALAEYFPYDIA
jgi:non-canonical poly(A) RNA polymerase PAPD5/7